jgi:diguanylate cyclase (GGDEF)-like protein
MTRQEQAELDRALAQVEYLEEARLRAEERAREAHQERDALASRLVEMTRLHDATVRESQARVRYQRSRLGQVTKLARTDALTGLPNRRSLDEELPRELARASRQGTPVCAVMLDIDHFKEFNDTRGHLAGDALLKETAAAWRDALRDTDYVAFYGFVARYGGEEFAVVLPDCDLGEAMAVVERLRTSMPGERTSSAGVALWNGVEGPDALLGRADEALYHAKRSGRDRTVTAA